MKGRVVAIRKILVEPEFEWKWGVIVEFDEYPKMSSEEVELTW